MDNKRNKRMLDFRRCLKFIQSLVVNKMEYVDTVYSKYMSSGTCAGYRSFQEVEGIITNVCEMIMFLTRIST